MPILKTSQLQEVLREAGIQKSPPKDPKDLANLLEVNNLAPSDLLDHLSSIARCGETEAARLRAVEMGLKLNGLLQSGESASAQTVTIIINDPELVGINPILIPR